VSAGESPVASGAGSFGVSPASATIFSAGVCLFDVWADAEKTIDASKRKLKGLYKTKSDLDVMSCFYPHEGRCAALMTQENPSRRGRVDSNENQNSVTEGTFAALIAT
jgi:hypothetical protein